MTELLTSLVGPAMEDLGKTILARVKRQFIYLCCFNSNIQSLRDEAEKLKNEREGLQMRVDTANRNTNDILPVVEAWLEESKKIQVEGSGIEDEIKNVEIGCLAIKSRFLLSRKTRKTADAMGAHRESCKFEEISVPALPPSMAPIPQETSSDEFDSRKQIEEEIMEDLRGRKVNMMGICGMGGVGKTTMAERIMERVRKENLFDEVVMAVVSQPVDMLKIQGDIAEFMGLKLEGKSIPARAKQLHDRLMGAKKLHDRGANRVLLILDDVWESLKLKEVGIPCGSDLHEGCTIVLTSRNKDVLSEMNAKPYAVQILSEEEAWFLFRGEIGTCVDDMDLLPIAEEVAKECKGLPLALKTIGTILRDKSSEHWKVALRKLRSSNPNIPKVIKEVYNPIKVSYDFLDNPDARSLFLLCCLFPEDRDIHLEYLVTYAMGLHMLTEEIKNLEEARDSVRVLLDMLKSCFLLLDGRDKNHIKMHDVVRDVAIFIASEKGLIHQNLSSIDYSREESINCKWISLVGEEITLPTRLRFPSLGLLLLDNCSTKLVFRIDPCFFQGMEELNVLYFGCIPFRSLPETTQLLKKLRTLYLEDCDSLETISIVGELSSLEILTCRSCHMIEELPVEIGRLERLKLLEVSDCSGLKKIAPGVISNLVQLEELVIVRSFDKWETNGNGEQRENAALCELEHLKNLIRLEIEIEDATLATEEIGLASTEYLFARGDGANNFDLAQSQGMKKLIYEDCSTLNNLVNITSSMDWGVGVFPLLESLRLRNLPNLEEICDAPIPKASNSFGNLKKLKLEELPALRHLWKSPHRNVSLCYLSSIQLHSCGKLRKLFPLEIARNGLIQLEKLRIEKCAMLEEVFSNEENEKDEDRCHITFPKLKNLDLLYLPKLTIFCKGSESIRFPMLHFVVVRGCSKLASLISCTWDSPHFEGRDGDSFHKSCNQKVIFGSVKQLVIAGYDNINNIWIYQISHGSFSQLEKLEIDRCNGNKGLFSSLIAENLVNLKELTIERCREMVTVIEDDEMSSEKRIPFPNLQVLGLRYLFNLRSFCTCRCDLQLPLLEDLSIRCCPLLEFLTTGSIIIGKKIWIEEIRYNSNIWCPQISLGFFGHLGELEIWYCNGIRSLLSHSISEKLVNLKKLSIKGCNEIVEVIEDDEEMLCEKPHLLFPCLQSLEFILLAQLHSFCRCDLLLPSLEYVWIRHCPLFEFFTVGSVSTPKLESIFIDGENRDVADLNGAIQLHFEPKQKKCEIEDYENNEEQTSSDGTNGGWDQKKDPGHDEINRISERDRVVDTLQLFPLNPLNTEADHSEKLGFFRDDYKKTNTTTFTNNGALAFDAEYGRWMEEQNRHVNELRAAVNSHAGDTELRTIVDTVTAHFNDVFRLKGNAAKADVFHILSGMWKTPAERCFMWIGGFRPSELLKLLLNQLEPLTEEQLMGVHNLHQSSLQAEDDLSQGMDALQQSLAETLATGSSGPNGSNGDVANYMGQMAMAMGKLGTLEGFLRQADNLRQQTLQQMHRILTTRQSARALLLINDYFSRLRALSSLWLARPRE